MQRTRLGLPPCLHCTGKFPLFCFEVADGSFLHKPHHLLSTWDAKLLCESSSLPARTESLAVLQPLEERVVGPWFSTEHVHTNLQTSAKWKRGCTTIFCVCVCWLRHGSPQTGGGGADVWCLTVHTVRTDQSVLWNSGVKESFINFFVKLCILMLQPAACSLSCCGW